MAKQTLDLFKLFRLVVDKGGLVEVRHKMSLRPFNEKSSQNCLYLICNHKYYTFLECDWFKRPIGQFLIGQVNKPITIKTAFQNFNKITKATTSNSKVERLIIFETTLLPNVEVILFCLRNLVLCDWPGKLLMLLTNMHLYRRNVFFHAQKCPWMFPNYTSIQVFHFNISV